MDTDFNPSAQDMTDCARRVYNGIQSRHIACLVADALKHALQSPAFVAALGPTDTRNLQVLFED